MLGELVQTTAGKWIIHPPARCPNGHEFSPGRALVVIRRASVMVAATRPGRAGNAIRRCVRATPEHPLHDTRRAGNRANLQLEVDPHGWRADCYAVELLVAGIVVGRQR